MKAILLIFAVATASLAWSTTVTGADLDHKCIRITLPFTPKTDMNGGALMVVNSSTPTAMSPLLIITALCSGPQDNKNSEARAQLLQKFDSEQASIKSRCVDAVDQRTIQHSSTFSELRFACTQSWLAEGGAVNRAFAAGSLIDLDGHLLVVGYVNTAPRADAEKQLDSIIGSLRSR